MKQQKKPITKGEKQVVRIAEKVLKNQDELLTRKQLARKISKHPESNVTFKTAKSYLSTFRKFMEKEKPFKTVEKPENQGDPTVYWTLQNQVKNTT